MDAAASICFAKVRVFSLPSPDGVTSSYCCWQVRFAFALRMGDFRTRETQALGEIGAGTSGKQGSSPSLHFMHSPYVCLCNIAPPSHRTGSRNGACSPSRTAQARPTSLSAAEEKSRTPSQHSRAWYVTGSLSLKCASRSCHATVSTYQRMCWVQSLAAPSNFVGESTE